MKDSSRNRSCLYGERLYRALDKLLPHKEALEKHLKDRLGTLFDLKYDLLLYDVTSTSERGTPGNRTLEDRSSAANRCNDAGAGSGDYCGGCSADRDGTLVQERVEYRPESAPPNLDGPPHPENRWTTAPGREPNPRGAVGGSTQWVNGTTPHGEVLDNTMGFRRIQTNGYLPSGSGFPGVDWAGLVACGTSSR